MEYVKTKYPKIYDEAVEFYNNLRKNYPEKHDLRKTNEFKQWKSKQEKQETTGTPEPPKPDNMELRIPLWNASTLASVQSLETVSEEVLGEGTIYPSLQEEISSELIEEILNDLRQDPDFKDMFEMIETEFEQIGAETEINEDNRLENELLQY